MTLVTRATKHHTPLSTLTQLAKITKQDNGQLEVAVALLTTLNQHKATVPRQILASLLDLAANSKSLNQARRVHSLILENGDPVLDSFLSTKLVRMYDNCGSLVLARKAFDEIPQPDIYLWNAMIRGYSKRGSFDEALGLFRELRRTRMGPDLYTFPCVLKACGGLLDLYEGVKIHGFVIKMGFRSKIFVYNALITMYAKCRCLGDARQVFDKMPERDVVSWNSMISGYGENGRWEEALTVFFELGKNGGGILPDSLSFASVFKACGEKGDLESGVLIHELVEKFGFASDVLVSNSIIAFYARCDRMDLALRVFGTMHEKDVFSWTSMIAGYQQAGDNEEALRFFLEMQYNGVRPNTVSFTSVLPACAYLSALRLGREIHCLLIKCGSELDDFAACALIDMYCKCGSLDDAKQLFMEMPERAVVLWNSMIAGFGVNGLAEQATFLFKQMEDSGTIPDHVTFVSLLSACSHSGMMDDGRYYFNSMINKYRIPARTEHYACMVDLLGRAGRLDEAYELIRNMPIAPEADVWGALLGACRIHRNIDLGELAAEKLFELKPKKAGYYVVMSNIYASTGNWAGVEKVRALMKEKEVKKNTAYSWVEMDKKLHVFVVGDKDHPQSDLIYGTLESLGKQMKESGYLADTDFVLHNVEDEEKQIFLCGHSERLAVAFGLINSPPSIPIRVTKNLRICGDCHGVIKCISKIVGREIIIRDIIRFHHFKNGVCSCKDYW